MKNTKLISLLCGFISLTACNSGGSGGGQGSNPNTVGVDINASSPIKSIKIIAENNDDSTGEFLSVESGNHTKLKLWALYENAESQEITSDVVWATESSGIVELTSGNNGNETVTAKSPGITTVTASYGDSLKTEESFIVSTPNKCFNFDNTNINTITGLNNTCKNETVLVIPPYVETIEVGAFHVDNALTSVYMPNVETIEDGAFEYNKALTSVYMPNVKTIGDSAFYENTLLSSVTMPNVETIEVAAFQHANALTSVYMPNVKTIGDSAFENNKALTSVYMPKVETIGHSAFYENTLLSSVTMPNVETIEAAAFQHDNALTSVYMPNVKTIGTSAFYGINTSAVVTVSHQDICIEHFSDITCTVYNPDALLAP